MLTNKDIAGAFQLLAKMMALHGESEFRIRAYQSAYDALKRLDRPLAEIPEHELIQFKGIGKSTAEKITEMLRTGTMQRLEHYAAKTPPGIQELLTIRGLGPAKVRTLWQDLALETPGELLYACQENRLITLSGFGMKTQTDILKQLEYHLASQGKYLWAALEPHAESMMQILRGAMDDGVEWVGEFARKCAIVEKLECLAAEPLDFAVFGSGSRIEISGEHESYICRFDGSLPFTIHTTSKENYQRRQFELTGDAAFVGAWTARFGDPAGGPAIPPELREGAENIDRALRGDFDDLVGESDILGILHCHSTYSDGLHSLREMAEYTKGAGYTYLGISDHSRSAVYANGLNEDRLRRQWAEIAALNSELAPFTIYKGIESDILSDGSLDYEDDVLRQFDFVIASVHSGLKMDEKSATQRLIRAIEHSSVRILGHPTGRLLLARPGYPVNAEKLIDACAQNGVALELNANPQRLDIDSRHLHYAIENGVLVSINPDAHSRESIHNVRYGIYAARKGGLPRRLCLNAMASDAFAQWLRSGRTP